MLLFICSVICRLFAIPWTTACQASLSFTTSWSLLKFRSIELVMPSNHFILCSPLLPSWDFQVALVVKNPPTNAGDARDTGSVSGLVRALGGGNGNPLQYSCWKIPWTEETGGPQCVGRKASDMTEQLSTHIYTDSCICIYIRTNVYTHVHVHTLYHFVVHLKLIQHCKSTIIQYKVKIKR